MTLFNISFPRENEPLAGRHAMTTPSNARRLSGVGIILMLLLTVFVAVAGWYSVAIPVGEGVDEVPHFAYVRYVKDQRALPVQPWEDNGKPMQVWMGHHPPLYYVVGALLLSWADMSDWERVLRPNPHFVWTESDPSNGWNIFLHPPSAEGAPYRGTILALHGMRFLSILLGAVTLFALYRIGRLLMPEKPWVTISAVALVAFNPSFLFMSSTVHHDPLIVMIFALSLWWMVQALHETPTLRGTLLGGALLAAGLLTKLSGLSLVLLFGLTLFLIAYRTREWRLLATLGVPLYGVAALGAGWWYVRNQLLYDDPLGWQMFLNTHQHMVRSAVYSWSSFRYEFLAQLERTFWGAFGYMHITLPGFIHRTLWNITAVAFVGALIALVGQGRILWKSGRWMQWVIMGSAAVLVFASFVRFSMATTGAGHGRYLFTIAAPFALTVAVGLNTFTAFRTQRVIAVLVTLGMLSYALVVLPRYVLPRYPAPEAVARPEGTELQEAHLRFNDWLELVSYEWQPGAVPPGEATNLTLYWRALGSARPDLYIHLHLRDRFGNAFKSEQFWPVPSLSTEAWSTETFYVTRHTFLIPPDLPTGQVPLEIQVQVGRSGEFAIAESADGVLGLAPQLTSLVVGRPGEQLDSSVTPDYPREEQLGENILLLGYDLETASPTSGDEVAVEFYWQALEQVDRNFTVFVQVLNDQMQVVAQKDSEPNNGQYPTSIWQPGEVVKDTYLLLLPADLPPGQYALIVGMYEWPSLQRLPVSVAGEASGDAIFLDPIQVR